MMLEHIKGAAGAQTARTGEVRRDFTQPLGHSGLW
jgi:hypothetical protein